MEAPSAADADTDIISDKTNIEITDTTTDATTTDTTITATTITETTTDTTEPGATGQVINQINKGCVCMCVFVRACVFMLVVTNQH